MSWTPNQTYVIEAPPDTRHYAFPYRRIGRIDLTPLAGCHDLETLEARGNDISEIDLSPLDSCHSLRTLTVSANPIERIDLRPLASCPNLETIVLAIGRLGRIDLSPLSSLSRLQTIDLASNRLKAVDLEPLSSCPSLREIDLGRNTLHSIHLPRSSSLRALKLGDNRLAQIDLSPLADCPQLDSLYLYHNQLTAVDLSPLHSCHRLSQLSLRVNAFSHLDVTPLIISDRQQPSLEVSRNVALTAWTAPARVLKAAYRSLVIEPPKSWAQVRPLVQEGWPYLVQQNVLSSLGFGRFGLIDCDLSEQLNSIPPDMPLDEVRHRMEEVLIRQVVKQIDTGGTTIGLRLEGVLCYEEIATRTSKMLELRRTEMERVLIPVRGNIADLRPLWLTAYGFDLLLALHSEARTDLAGLEIIRSALEGAGFQLRTTTKRFQFGSTSVTPLLGRCVLRMAQIAVCRWLDSFSTR